MHQIFQKPFQFQKKFGKHLQNKFFCTRGVCPYIRTYVHLKWQMWRWWYIVVLMYYMYVHTNSCSMHDLSQSTATQWSIPLQLLSQSLHGPFGRENCFSRALLTHTHSAGDHTLYCTACLACKTTLIGESSSPTPTNQAKIRTPPRNN